MIYTVSKQTWLKKILIVTISIFILIFWYTFASESNDQDVGDCKFVRETKWENLGIMVETRSWKNEIVYPKESIKRALLNLKAFCCKKWGILWEDTPGCEIDRKEWWLWKNYPDSKFLYDHLVDVWFRRLDAMENLLYEWVKLDPIWQGRRDFINKKWNQEEWTTPTDILPKFYEQWTLNTNYLLPTREDWNYNEQYQNQWTAITSEYNNRPLTNRYSNLCEVSAYIYWYLRWWLKLWYYTRTNSYPSCELLSKNIISRNIVFTKSIVLKKSNKLLYDNVNSHITNYISQSRLTKLKETILWIVQSFNVINKKVIKLIKECS